VDRQPKNSEDEDNEYEQTSDSALTRPRSDRHETTTSLMTPEVRQNEQREDGDDAQRDDVGEREERCEDRTTERLVDQVAVVPTGVADA